MRAGEHCPEHGNGYDDCSFLHASPPPRTPGFFKLQPEVDMTETFWNGLPTTAERGTATVAPCPQFPLYWAKDLIGETIRVVRVDLEGVNYGGGETYLDDRTGEGWRKVTEGHGSPAYPHGDLEIVPGSFVPCEPDATEG